MKRTILLVLLACAGVVSASAQKLRDEDFEGYKIVRDYYEGVLFIAEAITTDNDKYLAYESAIGRLAPVNMNGSFVDSYSPLALVSVDIAAELPANDIYTYSYARREYEKLGGSLNSHESYNDRGDSIAKEAQCRVKRIAIKPRSSVKYKDIVEGRSIVIAIAQPGEKVQLTVVGCCKGAPYVNGMVSFCKWTAKEEDEVIYHIENPGDSVINVVLIAN